MERIVHRLKITVYTIIDNSTQGEQYTGRTIHRVERTVHRLESSVHRVDRTVHKLERTVHTD